MEVNNNWFPVKGKCYDIDIDLNGRTYEIVELDEKPYESALSTLEKIEKIIDLNFKPLNLQDPDKILKISKQIHQSLQSKFLSSLINYDPLKKINALHDSVENALYEEMDLIILSILKISKNAFQILSSLTNNNKMNKINALHIRIERALYPSVSLPSLDETIQLILNHLPFKDLNTFCVVSRDAKKHGDISIYKRAERLGYNLDVKKSYNSFFKQIFEDFSYYQAYGNEETISINLEKIMNELMNLESPKLFKLICDGWHQPLIDLLSRQIVVDSIDKKIEEFSEEDRKLGERALIEVYTKNLPIEFLLKRGVKINVNTTNGWGYNFLQVAIKKNDCQMVKDLLKQMSDIDFRAPWGWKKTALLYAKNPEIAMLLIENGADINISEFSGRTLLHSAETSELIKFYLEKGLDINKCDDRKKTPLHIAVICDYGFDCVKFLLENGAAIDCVNSRGYTALQEAKRKGNSPEIIKLLEIHKTLTTECTIF